jgi:hypothetical protein
VRDLETVQEHRSIRFRYPIRFNDPAQGGGGGWTDDPNFLILRLDAIDRLFRLGVVRHADIPAGQAEEWYLESTGRFHVILLAEIVPQGFPGSVPTIIHDSPFRLTVGEVERGSGGAGVPTLTVTGGSLVIPLPRLQTGPLHPVNTAWTRFIGRMWPTRQGADVTHAHFEPSAVYLRGALPAGFFASHADRGATTTPPPVVLRLPRTDADWASAADPRFADRPDLHRDRRHFWTLTSIPFDDLPTAATHVRDWAGSLTGFSRRGLVDSVRSRPGGECTAAVFALRSLTATRRRLDWVATDLGTQVNLGGGRAAEATYQPNRLVGQAVGERVDQADDLRTWSTSWTARATRPSPDPTPGTLTLTTTPGGSATLTGTADLALLAGPVTPLRASDPSNTNSARFRTWVCTQGGWASLDAQDDRAEIRPGSVTPGSLRGTLELDRVMGQLQGRLAPFGLSVHLRALGSSNLGLTLSETREPVTPERHLVFSVTDPMVTAVTTRAAYRIPVDEGAEEAGAVVLPALTNRELFTVDKSTDPAAVAGEVRGLEEALLARFEQLTFVSSNVTSTPDAQRVLRASLRFLTGVERVPGEFALEFAEESVTAWHAPPALPLVRTFPLAVDQDHGVFLDANRGLLAFRPRPGSNGGRAPAALRFPAQGWPGFTPEPRIDTQRDALGNTDGRVSLPEPWTVSLSAGAGGRAGYLLPTIPGLELGSADADGALRWDYRQAVPVLDESYAETTERTQGDPASAPGPALPGALPPGFDPTLVREAVAFTLGSARAVGWLPRTDFNTTGELPISRTELAGLEGRVPALTIHLTTAVGGDLPVTLGRVQNPNGASLPIHVELDDDSARELRGFKATLDDAAPADPSPTSYADRVVRHGQPLMGCLVDGRVRTQDGTGRVLDEPEPRESRSREAGAASVSRRVSGREALLPGAIHLELVGIDRTDTPASGAGLQAWTLHDGKAGVPRLAGFPLLPDSVVALRREGNDLMVSVKGTLALDQRDPGATPLELEFSRPFADTRAPWAPTKIGGSLDFRLGSDGGADGGLLVLRVEADFDPRPAADRFNLTVKRLSLLGPTGLVTLENLDLGATLSTDVLEVSALGRTVVGQFAIELGAFEVRRASPDALTPDAYKLSWSLDAGGGVTGTLAFAGTADRPRGAWSLELTQNGRELTEVPLDLNPAAPGLSLFRIRAGDQSLPPFHDDSWFEREPGTPDSGVVGAAFASPTSLAALSADLLMVLRVKAASAALARGRVAAHLHLEAVPGAARPETGVRLSGELTFVNQIGLGRGDATCTHEVTLTLDRMPLTLDALFLGAGPGRAQSVVLLAKHRLRRGGDARRAEWQVVQPVFLRRAADYASLYLHPTTIPSDDPNPNRLVLDAGWVFWLADRGTAPPANAGGEAVLEVPSLGRSWRLRERSPGPSPFAREEFFVVRLPFLGHAGRSLPPKTIAITPRANRVLPTSGAQAGPTDALFAPQGADAAIAARAAETLPEFARRGARAFWLDPTFLQFLYAAIDATLLPAFDLSDRAHPHRLPPAFGDLGWALEDDPPSDGGDPGFRRWEAAALRTPYAPLAVPAPVNLSHVVEFPFTLEGFDTPRRGRAAPKSLNAQLLAFVGGVLRRMRSAELDLTAGHEPSEVIAWWAREQLATARKDEGALTVRDFAVLDEVPRAFAARRTERPPWPTAPLSSPVTATDRPPAPDPDPRRRGPDAGQPAATLLTPDLDSAPDLVFAARPEVPPEDLPVRLVAATRFRLARAGGRGTLAEAAVERAVTRIVVRPDTEPQRDNHDTVVAGGRVAALVKAESVSFAVTDPAGQDATPWKVYPEVGPAPYARRDGALRRPWTSETVPAGSDVPDPPPVTTVAPPMIDVVTWARRPGEVTRSSWQTERFEPPGEEHPGHHRVSVSAGAEIALRRPRAAPGPFEAVRIDPKVSALLLDRRLQFTRLLLTQTLDATHRPDDGTLYAVAANKSEIYRSAPSRSVAEGQPAILRKTGESIEPYSLVLVAHEDFAARAMFDEDTPAVLTAVVVAKDGAIPPTPPSSSADGLFVLVPDLPPPREAPWRALEGTTRTYDVLESAADVRPDLDQALATDPTEKYLLMVLRYFRPDPDLPWVAPSEPLAAVSLARIDAGVELVKPKSSLALLRGLLRPPLGDEPDPAEPEDRSFALSGYGRLDDDDFTPIRPEPGRDDERAAVAWVRTAILQSLDRLPPDATVLDATQTRPATAVRFDVVFFGPGGELIPTEGDPR